MEYDKRIKNLTALVIILTLMLLGCGVYIACTRVPKETTTTVIEKEEIIDQADTILNKLSNTYIFLMNDTDIVNYPNQLKLDIALFYLMDNENGKYIDSYTSTEIESKLQDIFGKNFKIKFEDIEPLFNTNLDPSDPDNALYTYDSSTKRFIDNENGFGLEFMKYLSNSKLIDYKVIDNEYILSYKQIFYKYDFDENDREIISYVTINGDPLFDKVAEGYDSPQLTESEIDQYLSALPITEYTFKLENNKLILKNFKIK